MDVTSSADGRLLARCFVSHETLAALEGCISAMLVTPDLQHAGVFRRARVGACGGRRWRRLRATT